MRIIKCQDLEDFLDWIDDRLTPEFPDIQDYHLGEAKEFFEKRGYKIEEETKNRG